MALSLSRKYLPVPVKPFRFKCGGGKKVVDIYAELNAAFRAGTVYDFRLGARSDDDPTIVWSVDGTEFAKADLAGVKAFIAAGFERAGIKSVEVGPAWCGYPQLTVEYVSGCVSVEKYDGVQLVNGHGQPIVRMEVAA
jgi:hypothetical protein